MASEKIINLKEKELERREKELDLRELKLNKVDLDDEGTALKLVAVVEIDRAIEKSELKAGYRYYHLASNQGLSHVDFKGAYHFFVDDEIIRRKIETFISDTKDLNCTFLDVLA